MTPPVARVYILLTALLFSTGGAAIKACSLTGWQIACFRSGVAAIVIAAGTRALRRLSPASLAVGAAYAMTLITFVTANKLTTAANTVFFQATAPLYIALLSPFWLGERARRQDAPFMAAIAAGIALLFVGDAVSSSAPSPLRGNVVGAVSGFGWCLTVMGLRWIAKRDPVDAGGAAASAVVSGNVLAFLVCLPFALPVAHVRPVDAGIVVFLGVFQIGMAYLLLTRAIPHVTAVAASILLLAEPAFSPVWAWLVHREAPGFWPLVGGGLIVAATTWKTTLDSRVTGAQHP